MSKQALNDCLIFKDMYLLYFLSDIKREGIFLLMRLLILILTLHNPIAMKPRLLLLPLFGLHLLLHFEWSWDVQAAFLYS